MSQLVPIPYLCPWAALSEHWHSYLLYFLASHSDGIVDCWFFSHLLVALVGSILPSDFSLCGIYTWCQMLDTTLGLNGCVPPQFLQFWWFSVLMP